MKGVIWHIYRNQQKGMIRGDDGAQVPFRKSALSGAEFYVLSSGQRVSYQVQDGWLGKEAVDVRPVLVEKAAENG
jgi:cold shock CspA family protein